MKKWVENKEPSGAVVHTLVFGHHGDDPKVIVELFRDSEGDWLTISNMLDTDWDLLTGKEMCEHDAKMMVEERVNPNVEYVIAAMRKKGEDIKNGISKVRCPEKGKPAAKEKCHSCIRP